MKMKQDYHAIVAEAHRQRDAFIAQGLRSLFAAFTRLFGRKASGKIAA